MTVGVARHASFKQSAIARRIVAGSQIERQLANRDSCQAVSQRLQQETSARQLRDSSQHDEGLS